MTYGIGDMIIAICIGIMIGAIIALWALTAAYEERAARYHKYRTTQKAKRYQYNTTRKGGAQDV